MATDFFGREIPESSKITFRRDTLAEALWEYGEDGLAEAALRFGEEDLYHVQRLALWHHHNDPEPAEGPKLTNGRIMARAAIEYVERRPRDTARRRRRTRPEDQGYTAAFHVAVAQDLPLPDSTPAERGNYEPPPKSLWRRLLG